MIAAIVGAIILIVLVLGIGWLVSPVFRAWAEKPKYTLLERDEMFERAASDACNDAPIIIVKELTAPE